MSKSEKDSSEINLSEMEEMEISNNHPEKSGLAMKRIIETRKQSISDKNKGVQVRKTQLQQQLEQDPRYIEAVSLLSSEGTTEMINLIKAHLERIFVGKGWEEKFGFRKIIIKDFIYVPEIHTYHIANYPGKEIETLLSCPRVSILICVKGLGNSNFVSEPELYRVGIGFTLENGEVSAEYVDSSYNEWKALTSIDEVISEVAIFLSKEKLSPLSKETESWENFCCSNNMGIKIFNQFLASQVEGMRKLSQYFFPIELYKNGVLEEVETIVQMLESQYGNSGRLDEISANLSELTTEVKSNLVQTLKVIAKKLT